MHSISKAISLPWIHTHLPTEEVKIQGQNLTFGFQHFIPRPSHFKSSHLRVYPLSSVLNKFSFAVIVFFILSYKLKTYKKE